MRSTIANPEFDPPDAPLGMVEWQTRSAGLRAFSCRGSWSGIDLRFVFPCSLSGCGRSSDLISSAPSLNTRSASCSICPVMRSDERSNCMSRAPELQ